MPSKKKKTFETSLVELESIISHLEDDSISLEDAMTHFKKGLSAVKQCRASLEKVEGQLSELLEGKDGKLVESILGTTIDTLYRGE